MYIITEEDVRNIAAEITGGKRFAVSPLYEVMKKTSYPAIRAKCRNTVCLRNRAVEDDIFQDVYISVWNHAYRVLFTDEGLNPDWLGEECRGARFAYVMPTFQNPSGRTISEERRRKLCEKAREYDFWLLEDDPYGEIYFGERPPVSLRAIAPERTIRMSSMSKVLAPGFRLGYIVAPKHVIDALIEMKQSVDLHTSTFTQLITAEVLKGGLMENHMPGTRALYAEQAKAMLDALEEFMPKHPELTWTKPTGGMFIWVTFPKEIDAAELMKKVLASDVPVGYVPGFAFYATEARHNEARLSFVTVPVDKIRAGVESIAKALKAELGL